jgi:hypothetical protein
MAKKKNLASRQKGLAGQIKVLPQAPAVQASEPLAKAIQRVLEPETEKRGFDRNRELSDQADPGILSHVNAFLQSWNKDLYMEPISLLSAEEADASIAVLSEKLNTLEQKLSLVKGLRALLEAKKLEPNR